MNSPSKKVAVIFKLFSPFHLQTEELPDIMGSFLILLIQVLLSFIAVMTKTTTAVFTELLHQALSPPSFF